MLVQPGGVVQGTGTVANTTTVNAGGTIRASQGDALVFSGSGNQIAGNLDLLGGSVESAIRS